MLLIDDVLISDLVIESRFQCDLRICEGCCCQIGDRGSPLRRKEVKHIYKVLDTVFPFLSPDKQKIIEDKGFYLKDEDHIELTCHPDGSCVFSENVDGKPISCLLEQLWFKKQSTFRKPIFCHLFPLVVETFYDRTCINMEERPECSAAIGTGPLVIESCKDALLRIFSEEFYTKLVEKTKEERQRLKLDPKS